MAVGLCAVQHPWSLERQRLPGRQFAGGLVARPAPAPGLFLTGQGNIGRDVNAPFDTVPEAPAGTIALRLTPRKAEPDYDSLTLVLQPGTLNLSMLITVDPQGGRSVFTFTNLKENVGLTDNPFVFKIPRGVDVVPTDAPK